MKYFFYKKVLSEHHPFIRVRKEDTLLNQTNAVDGEMVYEPVEFTETGQAFLFFLSTIVEFNGRK